QLKLEPNERVVFGLRDGFVRHESGQAVFGTTLDVVRRAPPAALPDSRSKATLALRIDGEATKPDRRHQAFEKSRERIISDLKRKGDESESAFALKKAMLDYQLAKFELVFSEASHATIGWTTSHEKKSSEIHGELTPAEGTSLARDLKNIG